MGIVLKSVKKVIEEKILSKVDMLSINDLPDEYLEKGPYCYRVYFGGDREALCIQDYEKFAKFINVGEVVSDEDLKLIECCEERLRKIYEKELFIPKKELIIAYEKAILYGKESLANFSSDILDRVIDALLEEGVINKVVLNSCLIGLEYKGYLFRILSNEADTKNILYCLGKIK